MLWHKKKTDCINLILQIFHKKSLWSFETVCLFKSPVHLQMAALSLTLPSATGWYRIEQNLDQQDESLPISINYVVPGLWLWTALLFGPETVRDNGCVAKRRIKGDLKEAESNWRRYAATWKWHTVECKNLHWIEYVVVPLVDGGVGGGGWWWINE